MVDNIGVMTTEMTLSEARGVLDSDEFFCDVDVPAAVLRMTKWAYYEAVKAGTAPVMPIRVGRRQRYRVSDVRNLAGLPRREDLAAS